MRIIVDTNIIFSCLLNTNSKIGDILFNSGEHFEFYSCDYMREEIDRHWEKLKKISKLKEEDLRDAQFRIFSRIQFIHEDLIPEQIWRQAEEIAKGIDLDDTDFIALTSFLQGALWTGDKELYSGLNNINFNDVFNTNELIGFRDSWQ